MLLTDKIAIIHGGGGPIGGAIGLAFAREGAHVMLAGRTEPPLARVAAAIRGNGGTVETAVVDALDEAAVDGFVDDVAGRTGRSGRTGRTDVSVNVIGFGDIQ